MGERKEHATCPENVLSAVVNGKQVLKVDMQRKEEEPAEALLGWIYFSSITKLLRRKKDARPPHLPSFVDTLSRSLPSSLPPPHHHHSSFPGGGRTRPRPR